MRAMKIVTEYVFPPIPSRDQDWVAYDEDRADADCYGDPLEFHWCGGYQGRGATREEALDDLRDQYEDNEELTPEVAAAIELCRRDLGHGLYSEPRFA